MGLDAQGTKAHGPRHEVLHDRLHALHIFEGHRLRSLLPTEEISYEDRLLATIHDGCPLLELLIVALSCGQLQLGDRLRIPGMQDTVLAPGELSLVLQEGLFFGCLMQTDRIAGNLFQSDTADGTCLRTEVSSQQILA